MNCSLGNIKSVVLDWLKNYDKIVILDAVSVKEIENFFSTKIEPSKQILLVAPNDDDKSNTIHEDHIVYINSTDYSELLDLYYMYSFSDKISLLLSASSVHPGLFGYYESGLMTIEEVFKSAGII